MLFWHFTTTILSISRSCRCVTPGSVHVFEKRPERTGGTRRAYFGSTSSKRSRCSCSQHQRIPGQGKYREMASCSNCTSYQAVRSKVRYREKPSLPTKYAHTLNSTLVATERAIVAIMENNQTRDGTVELPHVLQSYMNGQREIPQHR